ncbi:hypothetical protein PsYK624_006570 [Phanerochaete sordida]|uniref:Uncharacterized protein n=1 Tax=Phanerochaete sordida TaxID=48140 RepID=A0A9P3L717_9APHY|nr:hypothetical protein PsYK624_006570 [Phanerochaete sordida]
MLLSEADEQLLDTFDPPPPYEEEYDLYLFRPSRAPLQPIPSLSNAILGSYAVRGHPVAVPQQEVADPRPHHVSTSNSYDAPFAYTIRNARPPSFHLPFPPPQDLYPVELDELALHVRNLENLVFEERASVAESSFEQLTEIGYSPLFCSGLTLKSRHISGPLKTLYQKVQHTVKKLMLRSRGDA